MLFVEFLGTIDGNQLKLLYMDLVGSLLLKTYEFLLRRIKFYKRLFFKSEFMHNIFWAALLSDNSDDCVSAVFIPLDKATENVYLLGLVLIKFF